MSALGWERVTTPREAEPVAPRDPAQWLMHGSGTGWPALGGEAAVLLRTGEIYVGTLVRRKERLGLRLAGSRTLLSVARSRARRLWLVPPHSWEERKVIVERQRRGEPAAVVR